MITQEQIDHIVGTTAYDPDGDKIGKVSQVYLDNLTGHPEWLTVQTGWFGTKENFVPIQRVEMRGEDAVVLPYDKTTVKDAPKIDPEGGLSAQEEAELYHYYALDYGQPGQAATTTGAQERERLPEQPAEMTRSEERLRVGTERHEVGRVRLRKYVVTENVQVTVPVSHEEVRIVREPVTAQDQMPGQSQISAEEREVTLHAERPVVSKQTEAVERVRMEPETVTEQQVVSGQVRKERIATETENGPERDQPGR